MTEAEERRNDKPGGRVLLYLRTLEDVPILQNLLAGMAVEGIVCADVQDLGRHLAQEDVDALLVTEAALVDTSLSLVAAALQNQPSWSDLPVLFVAGGGAESAVAMQAMQELPNALILDRPVRMAALVGALQMALRMRDKQRQVRDLLEERRQAGKALETANENLEAQVDKLAAVNEQLLTEREEFQRQSLELHQLKERTDRTTRATERLARLVEENPDPALRVSADGKIQYKNPASFGLYGQWNVADKQSIPPALQEIVRTAYARTEIIRREMTFGKHTYLVTVAPAPPRAFSVNIFARDITERKQAEESLRESERRLALALSGTRIGLYDRDVATGRTVGTEQTARLLGLRPTTTTPPPPTLSQEYDYRDWAERVHPEDLPRVEAELHRCLTERVPYETEYRVIRPDGSVHWLADRGAFHYGPDDQPTRLLGILMGITNRKRVEEALRRSEERLLLAMEAGRVGVWEWETGTERAEWSQGIYALLGYQPGAVTPSHQALRRRIHPHDLARYDQALQHSLVRCEDYRCEFRVIWADGSAHWIEARGQYAYVGEGDGTVLRMRGVLSGIDERKRAEETLRASEERFHRLFEDDLAGNFVSTPDGRVLLCNSAFAAIFGFSRAQDAVGTSIVDLYLDPKEREPLLEKLRREGKIERLEVWRKRRDGEPIHIVENLVAHFDEQDRLYEIIGYLFEDTQRKQAEEALRESEERFSKAFHASPDGMVISRVDDGTIYDVNEAYLSILGFDRDEVIGRSMLSLGIYPDVEQRRQLIEALRREGTVRDFEMRLRRRDGAEREISVSMEFVQLGGQPMAVSLFRDITERKQAEEALRAWNATLESKVAQRTAELNHRAQQLQKLALEMSAAEDRERERIAHVLHDDLQQELAAAKFHLSIVRSRVKDEGSVQDLTGQINEMLKDAIAKARHLSHELSPAVLHQDDFAEILQWLAREMQARHALSVHVRGRAHCESDAIKAFLYRTAQELLFNAVKHAQVQEARVRIRQWGGCLCLSVSDRGRGFDPEQLREAAGFGLLSIRERIELLGGRMKIRSAPGKGSTFFVIVPESETAGPPAGRAKGGTRPTGEEGRLRVLLADDHQVVRQGLIALLSEEETIEVVGEATNGREAVELADRLHPDVVIMDVLMPAMSGEEATRQIKRDLPGTRIVALSMREEPEIRERMYGAGADSYVLKTAPYRELRAAIRGENRTSSGIPRGSTI